MSDGDDDKVSLPRVRLIKKKGEVGYCRPPRQHTWQPGQSGNPKGRRKGVKNEQTILRELLERKIEIRDGGRRRKITVHEAILMRFTEDSMKGNVKSAAFLLNRHAIGSGEAQRPDASEEDQEVLRAFLRRYGGDTSEGGS